jgi:hypothetical protein
MYTLVYVEKGFAAVCAAICMVMDPNLLWIMAQIPDAFEARDWKERVVSDARRLSVLLVDRK